MNHEVERYEGELKYLRQRVKELEEQLGLQPKEPTKVRVSGVPYEVEFPEIKKEIE